MKLMFCFFGLIFLLVIFCFIKKFNLSLLISIKTVILNRELCLLHFINRYIQIEYKDLFKKYEDLWKI